METQVPTKWKQITISFQHGAFVTLGAVKQWAITTPEQTWAVVIVCLALIICEKSTSCVRNVPPDSWGCPVQELDFDDPSGSLPTQNNLIMWVLATWPLKEGSLLFNIKI